MILLYPSIHIPSKSLCVGYRLYSNDVSSELTAFNNKLIDDALSSSSVTLDSPLSSHIFRIFIKYSPSINIRDLTSFILKVTQSINLALYYRVDFRFHILDYRPPDVFDESSYIMFQNALNSYNLFIEQLSKTIPLKNVFDTKNVSYNISDKKKGSYFLLNKQLRNMSLTLINMSNSMAVSDNTFDEHIPLLGNIAKKLLLPFPKIISDIDIKKYRNKQQYKKLSIRESDWFFNITYVELMAIKASLKTPIITDIIENTSDITDNIDDTNKNN